MSTTVKLSDGRSIQFNDQFGSLSPEDQQRAVAQAVQSLGPAPAGSGAQSIPAPSQPQREVSNNPLQGFANNAVQLAANTFENIEEVGDVASGAITLARAKRAIRRGDNDRARELISNNPFNSQGFAGSASEGLDEFEQAQPQFQSRVGFKDIKDAGSLASFVVDNTIASAPTGIGLALPGGAPIVATAEQRKIAEERAQRDGRTEETAGDLAVGGAASFFNTTLGRIGIKGSEAVKAAKALRPSSGQLKKLSDAASDLGRQTVRETITGAPQGAAEELAQGLGTEQGTTLGKVLESAATEALVGAGGGGAIDVATRGADFVQEVNDTRSLGKELLGNENRLVAAKQAVDEIEAERASVREAGGTPLPEGREDTQLARQSAARISGEVTGLLSELKKSGQISKSTIVDDLIADGNTFSKVDLDDVNSVSGKNSPLDIASKSNRRFGQKQIDQINELDLDVDVKESLTQSLLVIDELSRAGVGRNASAGPFETTFRRVADASATPLAIAGLGFGPGGFLVGGALTTSGIPGRLAAPAGRFFDGINGRSTPDIIKNADAINRTLKRRAIETESVSEGLEATEEAVSSDRSQVEDLVNRRRAENRRSNPAASARVLREQAARRSSDIRASKNKSRLTRLRNDPLGLKTPSERNPQTGLPKTFDGIVQQRVFQTVQRATGKSPSELGIVVGPGSFQIGQGPQGYVAALQIAFRKGLVTKQDVANFMKDPEALMEGARGLDVVIPAIQQVYLEGLELQGLTQQQPQDTRDIFNAPSAQ